MEQRQLVIFQEKIKAHYLILASFLEGPKQAKLLVYYLLIDSKATLLAPQKSFSIISLSYVFKIYLSFFTFFSVFQIQLINSIFFMISKQLFGFCPLYLFTNFVQILMILFISRQLSLGLDDNNFNFIILIEQISYKLTLRHIEDTLLHSRYCQLLFYCLYPSLFRKLKINTQSTIGKI